MKRTNRIGNVLRHVLALSIAPAAVACGIDVDDFEQISCGPDEGSRYVDDLAPKTPADYVELRSGDGFTDTGMLDLNVIGTSGDKCGGATDLAACEAAIAAAGATSGFRIGQCVDFCMNHIIVKNTGDAVEVLSTKEAVLDWIAPIDTAGEAVLAASLAGYWVACDNPELGGVKDTGSGFEVLGSKYTAVCAPIERTLYRLAIASDGSVTELESEVVERDSACIGRRPAGLVRQRARGATRTGAYLASVAHLEAASVDAFEMLAEELAHHGAPRSLVVRAGVARRDEIRHARVMKRLAMRHGGVARPPVVKHSSPRALEAIALENAAEGCVRETFGALVGMWQARAAKDPAIRRAMRRIAEDEARHAELAWAVDAWILPQLDEAARARVENARMEALEAVLEEARAGNDPELVAALGLPDQASGERLAAHFVEAIRGLAAS